MNAANVKTKQVDRGHNLKLLRVGLEVARALGAPAGPQKRAQRVLERDRGGDLDQPASLHMAHTVSDLLASVFEVCKRPPGSGARTTKDARAMSAQLFGLTEKQFGFHAFMWREKYEKIHTAMARIAEHMEVRP